MPRDDRARPPKLARFRSDDARKRFDGAYADALASWPLPATPCEVSTTYGATRANRCGASRGTPIGLLHGMMMTSTSWAPNVAALGAPRPVFALDTICDAGQSRHEQPVRGGDDLATWL